MGRIMALIATIVAATAIEGAMASDDIVPALVARSPWMKVCLKNHCTEVKTICSTGAEVWDRVESHVVAAVEIIEPVGEGKHTLRVSFPPGMQLAQGTRLIVDGNILQQSPYLTCSKDGCVSEYEISPEIMKRIKSGGTLWVQANDKSGTVLTASLLLTDFAEAYDGPPSDPEAVERQKLRSRIWLDDRLRRRPSLRPLGR